MTHGCRQESELWTNRRHWGRVRSHRAGVVHMCFISANVCTVHRNIIMFLKSCTRRKYTRRNIWIWPTTTTTVCYWSCKRNDRKHKPAQVKLQVTTWNTFVKAEALWLCSCSRHTNVVVIVFSETRWMITNKPQCFYSGCCTDPVLSQGSLKVSPDLI